jgi:hypothetical protein
MKQKRIEDGYYPSQKIKKVTELITQSAEWFDAVTDPPVWYNPVAIKLVSGEVLECYARVTYDGLREYYTRLDTDDLIDANEVVQWRRRDSKIMLEIMKKIKL